MQFNKLHIDAPTTEKTKEQLAHFSRLLSELDKHELPDAVIVDINTTLAKAEEGFEQQKKPALFLLSKQQNILKQVEKQCKLVAKKHYQKQWLALGMTAFGLPIGVVFGLLLDNMAYLGIGLPIGLSFGLLLGNHLDQKAKNENRQLDFELNS